MRDDYPLDAWQWQGAILRCEVGSGAHGTGQPGKEDHDEMGICVEPPRFVTGLDRFESLVWRPGRGPQDPSGFGDLDLTIYSARKWASLAVKGNPSILMMLFAPVLDATRWGMELRTHPEWFLHRGVVGQYIGYMQAQRDKLEGVRGGTHGPFRQELIETFGFDVKYAMHVLRLGFQGIEFLTTGRLILPIPEPTGGLLRGVRVGQMTQPDVLALADDLLEELRAIERGNILAPYPNRPAVNQWLHDATTAGWA